MASDAAGIGFDGVEHMGADGELSAVSRMDCGAYRDGKLDCFDGYAIYFSAAGPFREQHRKYD
ncbi:hypothetical protein LC724_09035 [Blautia sp. RD014234]|nr:hypothetical protein [Blautia parvula]